MPNTWEVERIEKNGHTRYIVRADATVWSQPRGVKRLPSPVYFVSKPAAQLRCDILNGKAYYGVRMIRENGNSHLLPGVKFHTLAEAQDAARYRRRVCIIDMGETYRVEIVRNG